jgi:hypothetical protein
LRTSDLTSIDSTLEYNFEMSGSRF